MINVVYALTRNLYPYLLPSIRSVMDHNEVDTIYILAEDDELPFELPEPCRVLNVSDQTFFGRSGANAGTRFTYMSLMRVTYPILLDCDRVINLDIDTICNDSLQEIFDEDLTGKWYAAVPEPEKSRKIERAYYNAGVVVFNLEQMRKDGAAEKLINLLNTNKMAFVDQDAINSYPQYGKVLPVRYNETNYTGKTNNPAVVHYAGIGDWYKNRTMNRVEFLNKYR